jgi:hypothetical protein
LVYNEAPVFPIIAEKSLDASHFASSSVSFSASSAVPCLILPLLLLFKPAHSLALLLSSSSSFPAFFYFFE